MVVGEDELRAVCCRLTPSLQEAARVMQGMSLVSRLIYVVGDTRVCSQLGRIYLF